MTATLDPLTLPEVRTLLAALDAGDDDALVLRLLADALEEAGEERLATGLRLIVGREYRPTEAGRWTTYRAASTVERTVYSPRRGWRRPGELPPEVYRLLYDYGGIGGITAEGSFTEYPTRSVAYLDLAQALAT